VKVEWDLDGAGVFADAVELEEPARLVSLTTASAYAAPGTYFAAVRVTSQRRGTAVTPYTQVQNLARARIVVHRDDALLE
jgi:hypothetical protein